MIHKVRGIALHHIKFKESSAVFHIYTDLFGRQSYLVHSIKGKKSRFSSNLLQPLTLLEMEVYHKEGRDLQRLKEIRTYIPYQRIPFDPYRSSQAIFLAEVLYRSLKEEDPTPGLFDYLEHSLQILDISEKNTHNFHLLSLSSSQNISDFTLGTISVRKKMVLICATGNLRILSACTPISLIQKIQYFCTVCLDRPLGRSQNYQ